MMSTLPAQSQIPLRLPSVFLHLWAVPGGGQTLEVAAQGLAEIAGIEHLRDNLVAILPTADDPADMDLALAVAHRAAGGRKLGILVFPGEVLVGLDRVEAVAESVLDEIEGGLDTLPGEGIYLTGYAASRLQGSWPLEPVQTPGKSAALAGISILRVAGNREDPKPWHNPHLLLRETAYVPRAEVEQALLSQSTSPVVRVKGALGCGKSRLVWETLGPGLDELNAGVPELREGAAVWISLRSRRYRAQPLAPRLLEQLVRLGRRLGSFADDQAFAQHLGLAHLFPEEEDTEESRDPAEAFEYLPGALGRCRQELGGPMRLIFDNLHGASTEDLHFIEGLLELPGLGQDFMVVMINRLGHGWPPSLALAAEVPIPAMTREQLDRLAGNLFQGLALPEPVQERLLEASGGLPLVLEEALIKMIHRKHLRRIYGNYFYSGSSDLGFEPSLRWIQLLESEARNLGDSDAVRLLSTVDFAVPGGELSAAADLLGVKLSPGWEKPFFEAGWLKRRPTPWGVGLELATEAHRQALAATVPPDPTGLARNTIGEFLAHASDRPDARWQTYNLLSGTASAVPPILELAREHNSASGEDSERILKGLAKELQAHRGRGGDQVTELHILWTMLPLARKQGKLEEFAGDLTRALEISSNHPRKLLAFASLKTELDLQKGRLEEGEQTLRGALEVVIDQDPGRQALLLLQLARLLIRQRRLGEARSLLEQLLPVLRQRKATAQVASCYFHLGNIGLHEDRLDESFKHHQKALKIRREEGHLKSLGASLSALGAVSIALGNYGQALGHYREAEEILQEHGESGETSFALLGLGRVYRRLGDFARASRFLRQALSLRGGGTDRVGEAITRLLVATNHLDLGKLEEAMTQARRASFDLRLGPEVSQLGDAEQLLGRIHLQRRQFSRARTHLRSALEIHRRHQDASGALLDLSWSLKVAMMDGIPDEIRRLCQEIQSMPDSLKPSERREVLSFRLYQATTWLREHAKPAGSDPILHLQASYRELLRKAKHLEADLRNIYLFQVKENAAILQAATEEGLSLPN